MGGLGCLGGAWRTGMRVRAVGVEEALSLEMRAGDSWGALEAGLGIASTNAQPRPWKWSAPQRGKGEEGKGLPERAGPRRPRGRWTQGRAAGHL